MPSRQTRSSASRPSRTTLAGLVRVGLLLSVLGMGAEPAAAQGPLTLEFTGGWAIPVGEFTEGPESGGAMSGGRSFGARFGLERSSGLDILVGFSQLRVDCSRDGCGQDEEWVSTQWEVGVRWKGSTGSVRPWANLSAIVPKVERDRPSGTVLSTVMIGAEIGAGATVQLTERWFLTPGVRYSRVSPEFGTAGRVAMRWATAQMGLLISF